MDIWIRGGTVVTCDDDERVLEGDVLVGDGRILAVGSAERVAAARQGRGPCRILEAAGCAVLPGFVQAHVHLCQVLLRGMADDLPLLEWLKQRIWPLEAAHDEASLRASADLGLLEMMRAGTTTLLDMGTVHHHDVVFEACDAAGVRAFTGKTMMDDGVGVPAGLRETTAASLAESDALAKRWHGRNDRLKYAFAPRFILSCSEELVRGAVALAQAHGAHLHSHASEHPDEVQAVVAALGAPDVEVLRRWGFSGPRALLAHGVQLTPEQARDVAAEGTRIVHCPSANLKLGSGIAPIAALDAAGVRLALGADGAPCNNNLDPWTEMRHAALLAKVKSGTTSLPARRVLRLATRDGAEALGLGEELGSIEAGKKADIVVARINGAHAEPGGDVVSRLVYACQARDVAHVLVGGRLVVKDGEHQLLDDEEVRRRARLESRELSRRAGLA